MNTLKFILQDNLLQAHFEAGHLRLEGSHVVDDEVVSQGEAKVRAVEPGLFNNLFVTRRGSEVILQTASQHAYSNFQQIFAFLLKRSQLVIYDSAKYI